MTPDTKLIWWFLGVFIYTVELVIKVISKILIPSASKKKVWCSKKFRKSWNSKFKVKNRASSGIYIFGFKSAKRFVFNTNHIRTPLYCIDRQHRNVCPLLDFIRVLLTDFSGRTGRTSLATLIVIHGSLHFLDNPLGEGIIILDKSSRKMTDSSNRFFLI